MHSRHSKRDHNEKHHRNKRKKHSRHEYDYHDSSRPKRRPRSTSRERSLTRSEKRIPNSSSGTSKGPSVVSSVVKPKSSSRDCYGSPVCSSNTESLMTGPAISSKKVSSLIEVQEFEMSDHEIDALPASPRLSPTPSEISADNASLQDSHEKESVDATTNDVQDDVGEYNEVVSQDLQSDNTETKFSDIGEKLKPYFPAIQGCRSVEEFDHLNKIEEGTYGVVFRAKCKRTNQIVALKRLKMEKEKEGFPITSLREINTLLKAHHPNVVNLKELVVGSSMDKVYIVMEYVEHDLKTLMQTMKRYFTIGEVKTLMMQLLRAVAHLHDNWILHRDLKCSNLLLSHQGILKVGDFGLAREYGSPLNPYTPLVVTLWYRAPELLLQTKEYSCPIDLWSVGCIFAELLTKTPLFQGKNEQNQIKIIYETLGTPNEKIWPGYNELPAVKQLILPEYKYCNLIGTVGKKRMSETGFDLLNRFLTYCPEKRITADQALKHTFFTESPLPVDPSMFSTWPAKSEQGVKRSKSPKPPSGGNLFSKMSDADRELGFSIAQVRKSMGFFLFLS